MDYRFTESQRLMVLDLDDEPTLLGCVEGVARRLSKPSGRRPALTERCPPKSAEEPWQRWKLNAAGLAVQAELGLL